MCRKIVDKIDGVLELTHSRYAVPLLDSLIRQPIITSTHLMRDKHMPTKPTVMVLLKRLREAGILKSIREAAGPKPQVLALAELVNLCEGKKVICTHEINGVRVTFPVKGGRGHPVTSYCAVSVLCQNYRVGIRTIGQND